MKRVFNWFVILPMILILLAATNTFVFAQSGQQRATPKSLYVKTDKENLRISPQGTVIGQVNKSAELTLLDKKGKWVKVAVIAWIWAPSVTENKDVTLGPKFRASLIMLEARTEAEAVLAKIKAGEDFGVLAKAKSIHPTSAKSGDLGFFRKGDFSAEFERAIFAVNPGQLTGIVEIKPQDTTYFCIFKRTQ